MARESCQTGLRIYATKRDALAVADGQPVARCDNCRGWHIKARKGKGRGKGRRTST